jgi:hypothetical protein
MVQPTYHRERLAAHARPAQRLMAPRRLYHLKRPMPPSARGKQARAGSCSETDLPIPIPSPLPPEDQEACAEGEGNQTFLARRRISNARADALEGRSDAAEDSTQRRQRTRSRHCLRTELNRNSKPL